MECFYRNTNALANNNKCNIVKPLQDCSTCATTQQIVDMSCFSKKCCYKKPPVKVSDTTMMHRISAARRQKKSGLFLKKGLRNKEAGKKR